MSPGCTFYSTAGIDKITPKSKRRCIQTRCPVQRAQVNGLGLRSLALMVLRKYSTHLLFPSPESIFGGLFVLLKVAEVSLFVTEYMSTPCTHIFEYISFTNAFRPVD